MASWSYDTGFIYYPAQKINRYWYRIDCGCCGGIKWGGQEPIGCNRCNGTGYIYWHKKSKTFAEYPGGKFIGRGDLLEIELQGSVSRSL